VRLSFVDLHHIRRAFFMRRLLVSGVGWLLLGVAACTINVGCTGSRWAKSDANYAAKYRHHSDNPLQMAKHAIDARFLHDRGGYGVATNLGTSPGTLGGELTKFQYVGHSLELQGGLLGLAGTGNSNLFGGLTAGARLQTPTRLAPFAGIGGLAAAGERDVSDDGIDNDNNLLIDEVGEDSSEYYAAIYPEVGAHFWMTPRVRLTTRMAYHLTTTGRDDDQWMFGIGLSIVAPGDYAKVPEGKFSYLKKPQTWQPEVAGKPQQALSPLAPYPPPRTRLERAHDGRPLPPR